VGQLVNEIRIPVTTTGSAGSATGDKTTEIPGGVRGALMSFYLDYNASAPGATTDVVISEVGGAGRTFLTRTNTATDGEFPVRIPETGNTGTAGAGVTPHLMGGGQIKVAVTGCDALTNAVVVTVYLLQ
jgi:hypothetical protein